MKTIRVVDFACEVWLLLVYPWTTVQEIINEVYPYTSPWDAWRSLRIHTVAGMALKANEPIFGLVNEGEMIFIA